MGARLYIPALGRFLSVDPIDGGTANNYAYVNDPINDFDLDGNIAWIPVIAVGAYLGFAAGAIYEAYKDPNPANIVWAGIAVIPAAGLVSKVLKPVVKAMAPKMTAKAIQYSAKIGGAFKTGVGKISSKLKVWAHNSSVLGKGSRLFGNARFGASGILNKPSNVIKIGWSHVGTKKEAYGVFRIGWSWGGKARHVDLFKGERWW